MAAVDGPAAAAAELSGPTCSSSFGDSLGPADSDVEVEQIRRETADSADSLQRSFRPPRERQLNPEWKEFRRSIEWRCRWLELRMQEVQLQSLRYKTLLRRMRARDHHQVLQDLTQTQHQHGKPSLGEDWQQQQQQQQDLPVPSPLPMMHGHVAASLHAVPVQFMGAPAGYQGIVSGVGMVPYLAATWQPQAQLWNPTQEPRQQADDGTEQFMFGGSQEEVQNAEQEMRNTKSEDAAPEHYKEASREASHQPGASGSLYPADGRQVKAEGMEGGGVVGNGETEFFFSPLRTGVGNFDDEMGLDAETAEFARNALAPDEGEPGIDSMGARHHVTGEELDRGDETEDDDDNEDDTDLSSSAARTRGYPDGLLPAGRRMISDQQGHVRRRRKRRQQSERQLAPSLQTKYWQQDSPTGAFGSLEAGQGPNRRKRLCRRRPHASFSLASEEEMGAYMLTHPIFSRYEKKLQQQQGAHGSAALGGTSLLNTPWGPSSQQLGIKPEKGALTPGAGEGGPLTVVQSPGHGHALAPDNLLWRVHCLQMRLQAVRSTLASGVDPKKTSSLQDTKKPAPSPSDPKKTSSDSRKGSAMKPPAGAARHKGAAKPSLSDGAGAKKGNSKSSLKPSASDGIPRKPLPPRPPPSEGVGVASSLKRKPKTPGSSVSAAVIIAKGAAQGVSVQPAGHAKPAPAPTPGPKAAGSSAPSISVCPQDPWKQPRAAQIVRSPAQPGRGSNATHPAAPPPAVSRKLPSAAAAPVRATSPGGQAAGSNAVLAKAVGAGTAVQAPSGSVVATAQVAAGPQPGAKAAAVPPGPPGLVAPALPPPPAPKRRPAPLGVSASSGASGGEDPSEQLPTPRPRPQGAPGPWLPAPQGDSSSPPADSDMNPSAGSPLSGVPQPTPSSGAHALDTPERGSTPAAAPSPLGDKAGVGDAGEAGVAAEGQPGQVQASAVGSGVAPQEDKSGAGALGGSGACSFVDHIGPGV